MDAIGHVFASWLVANAAPVDRRGRALTTLSGVVPDIDGIGLPFERLTEDSANPLWWYSDYHHLVGHNLLAGCVTCAAAYYLSGRNRVVALSALGAFHLHLVLDVLGSRGTDGYQWPIPYFYPFWNDFALSWDGQWLLSGWQNKVLGITFVLVSLYLARARGFSFFELLGRRVDEALVGLLRRWWPLRGSG